MNEEPLKESASERGEETDKLIAHNGLVIFTFTFSLHAIANDEDVVEYLI
jgi:hypothetical protein